MKSPLLACSISLAACVASPSARYAVASCVLRPTSTTGASNSNSEDTLLLPSESEALSDAMVVRRPEGVSGSVAMAIRWDRCHGGAAWNIHPLASFPRFPLLPPFLPRPPPLAPFCRFSLTVSLSFFLCLFLRIPLSSTYRYRSLSSRSRFSPSPPVYIRIHSVTLSLFPRSLPRHSHRPFRLFCS